MLYKTNSSRKSLIKARQTDAVNEDITSECLWMSLSTDQLFFNSMSPTRSMPWRTKSTDGHWCLISLQLLLRVESTRNTSEARDHKSGAVAQGRDEEKEQGEKLALEALMNILEKSGQTVKGVKAWWSKMIIILDMMRMGIGWDGLRLSWWMEIVCEVQRENWTTYQVQELVRDEKREDGLLHVHR